MHVIVRHACAAFWRTGWRTELSDGGSHDTTEGLGTAKSVDRERGAERAGGRSRGRRGVAVARPGHIELLGVSVYRPERPAARDGFGHCASPQRDGGGAECKGRARQRRCSPEASEAGARPVGGAHGGPARRSLRPPRNRKRPRRRASIGRSRGAPATTTSASSSPLGRPSTAGSGSRALSTTYPRPSGTSRLRRSNRRSC